MAYWTIIRYLDLIYQIYRKNESLGEIMKGRPKCSGLEQERVLQLHNGENKSWRGKVIILNSKRNHALYFNQFYDNVKTFIQI